MGKEGDGVKKFGGASNVWVTSGRGNAVHCPYSNQQQV
jgi:hypothetical protein